MTEMLISYRLEKLKREFDNGILNENYVQNLDDHYAIARRGSKFVDYTAFVPGGTGMIWVLRLSGGPNSKLEAPFLFSKIQIETIL